MMFMMLMPPTISETEAIEASRMPKIRAEPSWAAKNVRRIVNAEVVRSIALQPMALAQHFGDLLLDRFKGVRLVEFHDDVVECLAVDPVPRADDPAARGRQRNNDNIVPAFTRGILTLLVEHTDDREGNAADARACPQDRADGRTVFLPGPGR